jgi:hypothetical protein
MALNLQGSRSMKFSAGFAVLLATAIPLTCLAQDATSDKIAAPAQTEAQAAILVGAGTGVPVHVVGTLSSGSAKVDDVFQIQVSEDVVVDGMVVFRKGAGGQGHIAQSDAAGGNGHSGAISLAFDYVYSTDGGRVKLSSSAQTQAEEDRKGASSTATIIGFATFGIGGLFGHNLAHGRQKTIDEKTIMTAFVADNVHVQSHERAVPIRYDK